jgi:hypothetical protein
MIRGVTSLGRRLGVLVLVAGLTGGCSDDIELGDHDVEAAETSVAPFVADPPAGLSGSEVAELPRTLSFGDVEVVQMWIGEDAAAPVAIAVNGIRRADVAALARARARGLGVPPHAYYVDATLTFEGLGVIVTSPFITLAEGSRELNVHHYRLELQRPFPPCPGTGDGVTLRAGEPVDVCVVFPGPRPERVRGVSMLDEVGAPTWEGIVS